MKIAASNEMIHHFHVIKRCTCLSFKKDFTRVPCGSLHGGNLSIRHRVEARKRGVEEGQG